MQRIEKTVFLSYRRANLPWALAIYQNLTNSGYDVFFDFNGIAGGDFETVILENVRARAHFLVVLTPSALERCAEPGDWLRREIETAMEQRRNIVPLMLESFDFGAPSTINQLTGKLLALKSYNGLRVPDEFFLEAMSRLRERYLNVALDAVPQPASLLALQAAKAEQAAASTAPAVPKAELTAQNWFERGFAATDLDEAIRFYNEAIRLKPDYASAFYNRALALQDKGDFQGALKDYGEAIRLRPNDGVSYLNRGVALDALGDQPGALRDYHKAVALMPNSYIALLNRGAILQEKGDLEAALRDFDKALRLSPRSAEIYYNRGIAHQENGEMVKAEEDYDNAVRLKPDYVDAIYNRGIVREEKGALDAALQDYNEAIRLMPGDAFAYFNRAEIWAAKGVHEKAIADYQEYLRLGEGLQEGDQAEVEKKIRNLRRKPRTPAAVSPSADAHPI